MAGKLVWRRDYCPQTSRTAALYGLLLTFGRHGREAVIGAAVDLALPYVQGGATSPKVEMETYLARLEGGGYVKWQ